MIFSIIYLILFGIMSGSRSFLVVFITFPLLLFLNWYLNPNKTKIDSKPNNSSYFNWFLIPKNIWINNLWISRRLIWWYYLVLGWIFISNILMSLKNHPSYNIFWEVECKIIMRNITFTYSSHNLSIEVIGSIWGIIGLMIHIGLLQLYLYKSLKLQKRIFLKNRTLLPLFTGIRLFLYSQAGLNFSYLKTILFLMDYNCIFKY